MSGPEKFHSVFARNCEIRRIDRELAASFLNACHLYGDCAAFRYGEITIPKDTLSIQQ